MQEKQLVIKSFHRVGTYIFDSGYGGCEVSVTKQRGGTIYYLSIDSRYTGLNRTSAKECWSLAGEYLGITIKLE